MSGYAVVDVAIGLSFVFLILSVFATSIVEAVAGVLSYRAKSLEDWLAANLTSGAHPPAAADDSAPSAPSATELRPEQKRAKHILGHPVVYAMTKGTSRPSYIPRERFISALLGRGGETRARVFEALDSGADVEATIRKLPTGPVKTGLNDAWKKGKGDRDEFRALAEEWYAGAPAVAATAKALIDDLPDGPMRRAMRDLWFETGKNAERFRTEAETWFDQAMQRLSGAYKRRTQLWLWIVGFGFAVVLDVDAVRIADALWKDQTLRQLVVEQSRNASSTEVDLTALSNLPLGWDGAPSGVANWISTAVGLGLTSAAVSLGAPFWFDSLGKLANLRNAGPKPESAPAAPAPAQQASNGAAAP